MVSFRHALKYRGPLICAGLFYAGIAAAGGEAVEDRQLEEWFHSDGEAEVPQVGKGELLFLSPPPAAPTLHSINIITIDRASLDDGWVQIRQCHEGLDAVPDAEIVYRYRNMRHLKIQSKHNIGRAFARDKSVQLVDVGHDAELCIQAEAQILYRQQDGGYVLRNGPFHRRFLDGYFPLHVSLRVNYPSKLLVFRGTTPEPQPGFAVRPVEQAVHLDSWFVGTLGVEVRFTVR